jgi:hypothetical protein
MRFVQCAQNILQFLVCVVLTAVTTRILILGRTISLLGKDSTCSGQTKEGGHPAGLWH